MTDPANDWIAPLGQMLDGLGIAMCLFDDQDRTQAWNETFLRFFPEHAGHVHVGEPYCDNLRRFYLARDRSRRNWKTVQCNILPWVRERLRSRHAGAAHKWFLQTDVHSAITQRGFGFGVICGQ